MDEYIGMIKIFAGNFVPQGYLECNGALLAVSANQVLFSLLGTTYGGDGKTTFALPDLRGRAPVGMGTGLGLPTITEGEVGGTNQTTLTLNNLPMHTHIATIGGQSALKVSSGNATQSAATANASIATPGTNSGRSFTPTLGFNTSAPDMAIGGLNVSQLTVTNANAGNGQPFNNMPPYLGIKYIICTDGVYPSHQ